MKVLAQTTPASRAAAAACGTWSRSLNSASPRRGYAMPASGLIMRPRPGACPYPAAYGRNPGSDACEVRHKRRRRSRPWKRHHQARRPCLQTGLRAPCTLPPRGDIGVENGARKVLDTVAGLRPQLNLALGDLSYRTVTSKNSSSASQQTARSSGRIRNAVVCGFPGDGPPGAVRHGLVGHHLQGWEAAGIFKEQRTLALDRRRYRRSRGGDDFLDSGGHAHAVPERGPLPLPGRQGFQYADGQGSGPGGVRP
jgi:hypothetical protein